jgi:hypothetical protein
MPKKRDEKAEGTKVDCAEHFLPSERVLEKVKSDTVTVGFVNSRESGWHRGDFLNGYVARRHDLDKDPKVRG